MITYPPDPPLPPPPPATSAVDVAAPAPPAPPRAENTGAIPFVTLIVLAKTTTLPPPPPPPPPPLPAVATSDAPLLPPLPPAPPLTCVVIRNNVSINGIVEVNLMFVTVLVAPAAPPALKAVLPPFPLAPGTFGCVLTAKVATAVAVAPAEVAAPFAPVVPL
jgi:hypothetical protein